jgi:DNA helicase HerA-like ATPase
MSNLVLGWQVGQGLDPSYWIDPKARVGAHDAKDLFQVSPAACAAHTAIIAQSGSGKSYFLGRFVEELSLRTRARCLIFDPNADFRRVGEVVDDSLWKDAKYDMTQQRGKLPHEVSRDDFVAKWRTVPIRVRGGARSHDPAVTPVTVPWLSVSVDFLAENLGPVDSTGVRNCHNFVRIIHDLLVLRAALGQRNLSDYISVSERLLRQTMNSPDDFMATVHEEWGLSGITEVVEENAIEIVKSILRIRNVSPDDIHRAINQLLTDAVTAARSIGEDVKGFYFGKLSACRATGVIDFALSLPARTEQQNLSRLDVIDLPSIDDSTRLLVVNAVLRTEWETARRSWELALQHPPGDDNRVPLFVVVDEAHNLIPREHRNLAEVAIRDQFRTFVAEGRKYGVFVVLISQRPDKVDPIVLAECENRAVMKLSSETTVALTRSALGLEELPPEMLSACLKFPIGRALMVGPWSTQGPRVIYAAARRTVEGGRNLRKEYWAADPTIGT